ncbi:MAG: hypothetical protein K2F64_07175 [Muribaculaceae bacterium]|nr:hypothetical protein [Muribaculaceae bacterium]
MQIENRDRTIAAAVTLAVALIITLILFFTKMGSLTAPVASAVPEPDEPEVTFQEIELVAEPVGATEAPAEPDDPPVPKGEPEKADEPVEERVEPGPSPKPAPIREPKATQKKPSPLKENENAMTEAERKRLKSLAGSMNPNQNGAPSGHSDAINGKGAVKAAGSLSGRNFLGCTTGEIHVTARTVVRVSVTVDASGRVKTAKAVSGPSQYHKKCESWALTARWSEKKDAPTVSGSITFTITPKKG